jgi:hypothetical protein
MALKQPGNKNRKNVLFKKKEEKPRTGQACPAGSLP